MNPEVSRRAAKACQAPSIQELTVLLPDERLALADAVSVAETWDQIPPVYRTMLENAEAEMAQI